MNLIWHIIKKDLKRFRVPIAMFVWVVICKAVFLSKLFLKNLDYIGSFNAELRPLNSLWSMNLIERYFMQMQPNPETGEALLSYLLLCSDFFILIVIVLNVLYEDPPRGETTFWLTRPIGWWRMLMAKGGFLILVAILLPAIVQVLSNCFILGWENHHYNLVRPSGHGIAGWRAYFSLSIYHLSPRDFTAHWYDSLDGLAEVQAAWVGAIAMAPLLWKGRVLGLVSLLGIYLTVASAIVLIVFSTHHGPQPMSYHAELLTPIFMCLGAVVAFWSYGGRSRPLGFLIFGAGLTTITLVAFA